jgi:hypothetical protein
MQSSNSSRWQAVGRGKASRNGWHRQPRINQRVLRDHRASSIEALKRLDAVCGGNRFFDKAMVLLTRHWAESPWNGRAELLKAADWLIQVGARESSAPERDASGRP